MFGWFRSSPAPKICPGNPGTGTSIACGFSNAERTWSENADLLQILSNTMRDAGRSVRVKKGWLEVDDGFIILPQFVSMQPLEPSGVSTCSTIEVRHSDRIPRGVFEYQHSNGADLKSSFAKGFEKWLEIDFAVLQDALLKEPKKCMSLQMSFPAKDGNSTMYRRVLLGPVSFNRADPSGVPPLDDEHQPFCPCCLFTSLSEPLKPHLEETDFYAIRFFATRDADGVPAADCRINGMDWELGKQALLNYVGRWPGQGFEFRKQYGVLQSVEGPFAPFETEHESAD